MADPAKKTLKRKDKMSNIQELSGHQGLSTSDKVRARLQAAKAGKLREAKGSVICLEPGQVGEPTLTLFYSLLIMSCVMKVRTLIVSKMICLCPARLLVAFLN